MTCLAQNPAHAWQVKTVRTLANCLLSLLMMRIVMRMNSKTTEY